MKRIKSFEEFCRLPIGAIVFCNSLLVRSEKNGNLIKYEEAVTIKLESADPDYAITGNWCVFSLNREKTHRCVINVDNFEKFNLHVVEKHELIKFLRFAMTQINVRKEHFQI